jgi:hypothetical protein
LIVRTNRSVSIKSMSENQHAVKKAVASSAAFGGEA